MSTRINLADNQVLVYALQRMAYGGVVLPAGSRFNLPADTAQAYVRAGIVRLVGNGEVHDGLTVVLPALSLS